MPHGACYLWRPEIVWLHAISDGFITLSYYLIPVFLIYFVVKRSHVALHTNLADDLPVLMADRVQLQQVLLNLMMNGIEAMNEIDGRSRELTISSESSQDPVGVLVAVRDGGTGLNPQSNDRIFETFFTTKAEGMGMGLSIGRSIINAHGGRLWAETNPDHGATFRFTIPAAAEGHYEQAGKLA
jgi:signal transduction histidine kinase